MPLAAGGKKPVAKAIPGGKTPTALAALKKKMAKA
jgi:hypothetical protein